MIPGNAAVSAALWSTLETFILGSPSRAINGTAQKPPGEGIADSSGLIKPSRKFRNFLEGDTSVMVSNATIPDAGRMLAFPGQMLATGAVIFHISLAD
jgi:hypothetical protein